MTVHDGCQLDIVREVVFISNDGVNWTAEVSDCLFTLSINGSFSISVCIF